MKKNESKKLMLNLDDLKVESFETLPDLQDEEMRMVASGASSCCSSCSCDSGDTVVCTYPSGGGIQ